MRIARNLEKAFKYSMPNAEIDKKVSYIDSDGNEIILDTGDKSIGYSVPIEFKASIAMSGGEAEAKEYGLSVSDYDAVLTMPKQKNINIDETAVIWENSDVLYKDEQNITVDEKSADYTVKRAANSKNITRVLLKKVTK